MNVKECNRVLQLGQGLAGIAHLSLYSIGEEGVEG